MQWRAETVRQKFLDPFTEGETRRRAVQTCAALSSHVVQLDIDFITRMPKSVAQPATLKTERKISTRWTENMPVPGGMRVRNKTTVWPLVQKIPSVTHEIGYSVKP